MRILRVSIVLVPLALWLTAAPAWAVNRDLIQLQTQVQQLQDQMTHMQQSFDERMGVMKSLLDQNTDNINKATAAVSNLQTNLQRQQTDSGTHVDQLSGQLQTLNDTLDELKARLDKVSKQLEDMQAAQQNLATQQPAQGQLGHRHHADTRPVDLSVEAEPGARGQVRGGGGERHPRPDRPLGFG